MQLPRERRLVCSHWAAICLDDLQKKIFGNCPGESKWQGGVTNWDCDTLWAFQSRKAMIPLANGCEGKSADD
jgi:hypothetical protein